jgi:hypothetical protein
LAIESEQAEIEDIQNDQFEHDLFEKHDEFHSFVPGKLGAHSGLLFPKDTSIEDSVDIREESKDSAW